MQITNSLCWLRAAGGRDVPPDGDQALELWSMTIAYAHFPGLYEIKTPKTQADLAHIGNVFNPYLRAREWNTVQNPAL